MIELLFYDAKGSKLKSKIYNNLLSARRALERVLLDKDDRVLVREINKSIKKNQKLLTKSLKNIQ